MNEGLTIFLSAILISCFIAIMFLTAKKKCRNCGNDMNYHEDYNKWGCPVCGYSER